MLYAILGYDREDVVNAWSKDEDDAVMERLMAVQAPLAEQGRIGPVARLLPTTAATTIRKGKDAMILDGPFAETKEQLLGFYIIDVADLDEALGVARELGEANPGGAYEIRPLAVYNAGVPLGADAAA